MLAASFVGLLGVLTGGAVAGGLLEARAHRHVLNRIPLRVHVNGTRGKTSVTRAIASLFRNLGRTTMAKCTGTLPLWIAPDGSERPWPRRGRVRVHEQTRFLRLAARHGVNVAVIECMAVDPVLQWVCEHKLVQSHIGVITNVRRDHLEEMGPNLDDIARSLANTIPRNGVLVTADARFAPLFEELAKPLGTRVVLATPTGNASVSAAEVVDGPNLFPKNFAIAREVARVAGFSDEDIERAMPSLPHRRPPRTALPPPAAGSVWVHAWSMNDTDSMAAFLDSDYIPYGRKVPLFNHRMDRPLRALDFGRLFASGYGVSRGDVPRVLVTGDPAAERLLRRAGVRREAVRRVPFPPTAAAVASAVADLPGPPLAVIGCGNARGLAGLEALPDECDGILGYDGAEDKR